MPDLRKTLLDRRMRIRGVLIGYEITSKLKISLFYVVVWT